MLSVYARQKGCYTRATHTHTDGLMIWAEMSARIAVQMRLLFVFSSAPVFHLDFFFFFFLHQLKWRDIPQTTVMENNWFILSVCERDFWRRDLFLSAIKKSSM